MGRTVGGLKGFLYYPVIVLPCITLLVNYIDSVAVGKSSLMPRTDARSERNEHQSALGLGMRLNFPILYGSLKDVVRNELGLILVSCPDHLYFLALRLGSGHEINSSHFI